MAALCTARHQSAAAGPGTVLGLEVELELTGRELPLGQGAPQHCTGVSKRGVLLLADCEPPPACAEAPSRQAACLRLPPPSISPESQPGAPGPWLSPGWGSPSLFSGFTSFSQAGLPASSLLFLQWVSPFWSSLAQVPYPFLLAEFQHPGYFS